MTFIVQYTRRAINDIYRNAHWWASHHSLQQALDWEETVEAQIESLSTMPERHGYPPENSKLPFDVRQKLVGMGSRPSYRAVYTIRENVVLVLAVCRSAEDELSAADLLS